MPMTWLEHQAFVEEQERLRSLGLKSRAGDAGCADCGHPMHQSPLSADDRPDADFNPLSDHTR